MVVMAQQVNNKIMNKIYTTIKQVSATPMSAIEAMAMNYKVGDGLEIEGYEITYEDGYKSWCPKEVFLRNAIISAPEYSYTVEHHEDYPDYVKRMQEEYNELRERFIKLTEFINYDSKFEQLTEYQKHLLILQHKFMDGYINCLGTRLYYETKVTRTAKK